MNLNLQEERRASLPKYRPPPPPAAPAPPPQPMEQPPGPVMVSMFQPALQPGQPVLAPQVSLRGIDEFSYEMEESFPTFIKNTFSGQSFLKAADNQQVSPDLFFND